MSHFTQNELMEAMQKSVYAPEETPSSITTPELAEHMGISYNTARRVVKRALKAKLLRATRVIRLNMGGSYQSVYGYVLTEKGKGLLDEKT